MKNLRVGKKLAVLIIAMFALLSIVLTVGVVNSIQTKKVVTNLYDHHLVPGLIVGDFRSATRTVEEMLLAAAIEPDAKVQNEHIEVAKTRSKDAGEHLTQLQAFDLTAEEKSALQEAVALYPSYQQAVDKDIQLVTTSSLSGTALIQYKNELIEFRNKFSPISNKMQDLNKQLAAEDNTESAKDADVAVWTLSIIGAISLIVAVILGIYITRLITIPLARIQVAMELAEEGDFTKTLSYQSKDEIGILTKSYNHMTAKLRELISQISRTSDKVATFSETLNASASQTSNATEYIASSMQDVAVGTDNQVQQLIDTTTTLEKMDDSVEKISTSANIVSKTSSQAAEKSLDGNKAIEMVISQMETINNAIQELSVVISGLEQRSGEIGEIVQVITGIAAQTNLLALNAAIEAARAGEQGKGFAVVADEVRKLAEQSGASASQISTLISSIQSETEKAVKSMQFATEEVSSGSGKVNDAGSSFKQIQQAVGEIVVQIKEVTNAFGQMSKNSQTMYHTLESVKNVAQSNSGNTQSVSAATEEQLAVIEEISASSASLADMAEELQNKIHIFKV